MSSTSIGASVSARGLDTASGTAASDASASPVTAAASPLVFGRAGGVGGSAAGSPSSSSPSSSIASMRAASALTRLLASWSIGADPGPTCASGTASPA